MSSQSTNPGRGSVVQLRQDDRSGERSRNALFRQLRRQLKIGKNYGRVHNVTDLKYSNGLHAKPWICEETKNFANLF